MKATKTPCPEVGSNPGDLHPEVDFSPGGLPLKVDPIPLTFTQRWTLNPGNPHLEVGSNPGGPHPIPGRLHLGVNPIPGDPHPELNPNPSAPCPEVVSNPCIHHLEATHGGGDPWVSVVHRHPSELGRVMEQGAWLACGPWGCLTRDMG